MGPETWRQWRRKISTDKKRKVLLQGNSDVGLKVKGSQYDNSDRNYPGNFKRLKSNV